MENSLLKYLIPFMILAACILSCGSDPVEETTKTAPSETTVEASNIAKSKFDQAIAADPQNHELYFQRAKYYHALEGYDQAIDDLKEAIKIDSSYLSYHHLLGDVYMDYYKSRPALKTLENAAELFPDSLHTLLKLCEYQYILKKFDESVSTCQKILKKDPQNAEAFYMLGRNFRVKGDTKRAINSFQTCVENDSDHLEAYFELGNLFDKDKKQIAEKYYDNALRIAPDNVDIIFAKANHYHNLGKLNKAIVWYKKAGTINPQYADAFYNTGLAYLELDSLQLGYKHFDMTVNISPTHIMGFFYRGYASEAMGNLSKAKKDYEQVLSFAPEYDRGIEALENINKKIAKK